MSLFRLFVLLAMASSTGVFASVPESVTGRDLALPPSSSLVDKRFSAAKATVVVFLSARCPCSAAHESALKDLHKRYGERFAFVGVHSNQDEPEAEAETYFRAAELPFPVISDRKTGRPLLADQFGAVKTPHAFLVDSGGKVLYSGGIDDSKDPAKAKRFYVAEALQAIAEGKTPPSVQTRALGCVIKR